MPDTIIPNQDPDFYLSDGLEGYYRKTCFQMGYIDVVPTNVQQIINCAITREDGKEYTLPDKDIARIICDLYAIKTGNECDPKLVFNAISGNEDAANKLNVSMGYQITETNLHNNSTSDVSVGNQAPDLVDQPADGVLNSTPPFSPNPPIGKIPNNHNMNIAGGGSDQSTDFLKAGTIASGSVIFALAFAIGINNGKVRRTFVEGAQAVKRGAKAVGARADDCADRIRGCFTKEAEQKKAESETAIC